MARRPYSIEFREVGYQQPSGKPFVGKWLNSSHAQSRAEAEHALGVDLFMHRPENKRIVLELPSASGARRYTRSRKASDARGMSAVEAEARRLNRRDAP